MLNFNLQGEEDIMHDKKVKVVLGAMGMIFAAIAGAVVATKIWQDAENKMWITLYKSGCEAAEELGE